MQVSSQPQFPIPLVKKIHIHLGTLLPFKFIFKRLKNRINICNKIDIYFQVKYKDFYLVVYFENDRERIKNIQRQLYILDKMEG